MTREELIEIMDNTWGEDEDCIDALLEFLGGDTELVADVLKHDRSFNRYYCSYSWSDLAYEIIHDDAFDGDEIDWGFFHSCNQVGFDSEDL